MLQAYDGLKFTHFLVDRCILLKSWTNGTITVVKRDGSRRAASPQEIAEMYQQRSTFSLTVEKK